MCNNLGTLPEEDAIHGSACFLFFVWSGFKSKSSVLDSSLQLANLNRARLLVSDKSCAYSQRSSLFISILY